MDRTTRYFVNKLPTIKSSFGTHDYDQTAEGALVGEFIGIAAANGVPVILVLKDDGTVTHVPFDGVRVTKQLPEEVTDAGLGNEPTTSDAAHSVPNGRVGARDKGR